MGGIWGIVLAAGESKRMGFPKMLLIFNGKTMIENVLLNIADSEVNNIMVVLGANSEAITELVEKSSVEYCYNHKFEEGMLSSVMCGISHIPSEVEAVLVFQGDQPFIKPGVINKVIEAYRTSNKGIVIPVYKKKRGHPLLIDIKYRSRVNNLNPEEGLRSLAYQFADDVLEIDIESPGILRDFNTYEDYIKEINQNE